jgi:hypothetical protein
MVARRPLSDTEQVWAITAGFLLTLYPATCARDEYDLQADVYDRAGTRLKSYTLHDSETSWVWMFHGENCGTSPLPARIKEVAGGLLETLYRDVGNDRLPALALAPGAPGAAQAGPRVYVSANRAQDIVQRTALAAEPLANFVFGAADARSADYTLSIELDFGSSEQTLARTIAAIGTIGIVSGCQATAFELKAKIADRGGREVRAYDLRDSYRSRFAPGSECRAVDEDSDPEDVAKFVGKLFARIKADRVFTRGQ